jgi:hypothetical protein
MDSGRVKLVDSANGTAVALFGGIIAEHHAVRQRAGLFDVSHMAVMISSDPQSTSITWTNPSLSMRTGKILIRDVLPERTVEDDLIVYRSTGAILVVMKRAKHGERTYLYHQGESNVADGGSIPEIVDFSPLIPARAARPLGGHHLGEAYTAGDAWDSSVPFSPTCKSTVHAWSPQWVHC